VTGDPPTVISEGAVNATEVTVPVDVPAGTAKVESSLKNFVVPAAAPGSGTRPVECPTPDPTNTVGVPVRSE
jgi:hypothetical protein